jgi:hypothetical protein
MRHPLPPRPDAVSFGACPQLIHFQPAMKRISGKCLPLHLSINPLTLFDRFARLTVRVRLVIFTAVKFYRTRIPTFYLLNSRCNKMCRKFEALILRCLNLFCNYN